MYQRTINITRETMELNYVRVYRRRGKTVAFFPSLEDCIDLISGAWLKKLARFCDIMDRTINTVFAIYDIVHA